MAAAEDALVAREEEELRRAIQISKREAEERVKQENARAKAEKKLVLVNFTGSDWCGWCIKLDREVFSKDEFAAYAEKSIVPVKIDFPRRVDQPAELKKANRSLQEKYEIRSFPTIVVLDAEGKETGRLGYRPGGPKAFVEALEKLKK